jgi:hypothetical protein
MPLVFGSVMADFSVLATAYSNCTGQTGCARADLNDDRCIRGAGFPLLATSYVKTAPQTCAPTTMLQSAKRQVGERLEVSPLLGTVDLTLSPATQSAAVNEVFTIDLGVVAGAQSVKSTDMYVEFDPTVLMVVDSSGNPVTTVEQDISVFNSVVWNSVDNSGGLISYSAGKLGSPASGTFRVAIARFKKIAASTTTIVRYQTGSDIWYAGESVLGTLGSAEVTGPQGATPTGTLTPVVPIPTRTPTPTHTLTPVLPMATPTRTLTPTPTETLTVVPPTATRTPTQTSTPVPPTATLTRTQTLTPVAPTATPTRTLTPTATQTPVPTATRTATWTATPSRTPTATEVPAQTDTPVEVTATLTPAATLVATATLPIVPTATATSTHTPTLRRTWLCLSLLVKKIQ